MPTKRRNSSARTLRLRLHSYIHGVELFWFRELSATPHAFTLPSTTAMAEAQVSGSGAVQSSGDADVVYVNDVLQSPTTEDAAPPAPSQETNCLVSFGPIIGQYVARAYCSCDGVSVSRDMGKFASSWGAENPLLYPGQHITSSIHLQYFLLTWSLMEYLNTSCTQKTKEYCRCNMHSFVRAPW